MAYPCKGVVTSNQGASEFSHHKRAMTTVITVASDRTVH
jgi:hypothetical protein